MNYDCTITTKFLSKYCIKRILDKEMNWLSLFQFYRKTFFRSVDPKQPKNFTLIYHWNFPKGRCMAFQGRCKNSQWRCKTISGEVPTSPHLPSKSGQVFVNANVRLPSWDWIKNCVCVSLCWSSTHMTKCKILKVLLRPCTSADAKCRLH